MVQAALSDGVAFNPFAFEQDGLAAPEIDVGWGEIVEAFVVSTMIVILDEGRDLRLKVFLEDVVFQQDGVTTRKCWICPTFENVW